MSLPLPALFGPDRSSLTQLYPFERNCSSPASTRPFRARPLAFHPTVSIQSQPPVFHSHRVNSNATARLQHPPRFFAPDRSSPSPTVSIRASPTTSFRARLLVSHPHSINLSATTRVSLPPSQLEPDSSSPASTASIRAQPPVSHSHRVNFERDRLCPTSTESIRARPLVSHLDHQPVGFAGMGWHGLGTGWSSGTRGFTRAVLYESLNWFFYHYGVQLGHET